MANPTLNDLRHLLTRPGIRVQGMPDAFPAAVNRTKVAKGATMNRTEKAYSEHLERLRIAGEVVWWDFDKFKLRLADGCFYTPDFFVVWADGRLTCDETKGFERDDAVVKFKVAAAMFPMFAFRMIKRKGGQWEITRGDNA